MNPSRAGSTMIVVAGHAMFPLLLERQLGMALSKRMLTPVISRETGNILYATLTFKLASPMFYRGKWNFVLTFCREFQRANLSRARIVD